MRESTNLEFKEIINQGFLKTVSAYANYNGGTIKFGVKDVVLCQENGEVKFRV